MLLEKPMAHDVEGASLIAEALMVGSARCLVNHVLRHDARYTVVHREADPNRLGEVVHMTAARNSVRSLASRLGSASSILFYLGVHDVDAVQWIARSAILRVFARSVNRFGHATEDALFVNFELANGGIGAIHYSWAWPEGLPAGFNQQLEIVGTRSSASLDTRHDGLSLIGEHGQQSDDTYLWPEVHGQPTGCLRDSVEHFLRAVQLDEPFVQDWRDALSAIEVLDAIRESVARGVEIEVDRNVSSRLRASQRTNP